jgi:DNA polymerase III subunit alpha
VGEGAIRSVLQYRREHGRYQGIYQFCQEVDSRSVNKRVLESLIKSGALDSFGWRRSQLMTSVDSAIEHGQKAQRDRESGQRGLFSDLAAGREAAPDPDPPNVPEWPIEQLLQLEKETLGYYISGHPLEKFAAELQRVASRNIADLLGDGATTDCKAAGIVTECRTRRTKKGDLMAVFNLEDLTGSVETVVFPSLYAKCEALLQADTPILVTGRFEVEDENGSKIIASELQPLSGLAERSARLLKISAAVSKLSPDAATQLQRLFSKNRGETGVNLDLYHPCDFRVSIHSSEFVKVKSSPELIRQIEAICGPGSVTITN